MNDRVHIKTGIPEDAQSINFMNATLQGAGESLAFSVATFIVNLPDPVANDEGALADFLRLLLADLVATANSKDVDVSFEVEIGPAMGHKPDLRGTA